MKVRNVEKGFCVHSYNKRTYEIEPHFTFWFKWNFELTFEVCGYFDNRPRINIGLLFFAMEIVFPFRNKWTDECDPPKWGASIREGTLWMYRGGDGNMKGGSRWKAWRIPFLHIEWYRTSILLKNGEWEHEYKSEQKYFYKKFWKEKQMSWNYDYTDKCDGSIIPTTIYVEEREWRPKWLMWTNLFSRARKTIDIHFSDEVGKEKGSWKGGVMGCSYQMLPNEHPLDCLKRMEKERIF